MEVRPGYKQTEIGIIPEDWDVPFLRQHLLQDATYGVVKAGAFQRTGIPMLRGGDIKNGLVAEDQPLITADKSQEYSRTVLKERDVVIALVGYPGETAVIPERLVGANISRAVGLLRPAPKLSPEFLACYLNSPSGRREFLRPSAGSAQIVVNLGALNRLQLPLPSLPEQHAIATVVSDLDALLGGLDRLIAKKRDLKQATMQELLTGQTRLPGFHGEWEATRLGSLLERLSNGALYRPSTRDGVLVTRIETIADGVVDYARTGVAIWEAALAQFALGEGDILFSHINSVDHIGKVAIVPADDRPLFHGMNLLLMRVTPTCNAKYLFYWLSSEATRRCMRVLAKQAVSQASINTAELRAVVLSLPNREEQDAITVVLSDIDAELTALEARRDKTRDLKRAMMQELLTGKTRLVPAGDVNA